MINYEEFEDEENDEEDEDSENDEEFEYLNDDENSDLLLDEADAIDEYYDDTVDNLNANLSNYLTLPKTFSRYQNLAF